MQATALTVLAAAIVALLPGWADAADQAACNLTSSTLGDYYANTPTGPTGEDLDFVQNSTGTPTIMFLIDSSLSMAALPPDGPKDTWGGLGSTYGCNSATANAFVFHSPCGTTTVEGSQYSETINFAEAADAAGNHCPSLVAESATLATNRPGFDPDFYCPGGGTTCDGHANLFQPTAVYLDESWELNSTTAPQESTGRTAFCDTQTSSAQRSSCNSCLRNEGYWYDGSKVHYTGNFLNFYPPKFLIARKVLKDTVANAGNVRMALAKFGPGGDFGQIIAQLGPGCNQIYPPVQSGFDTTRDAILHAVNSYQSESGTPLGEALLSIGQFFHSRTLPWFGDSAPPFSDPPYGVAGMDEGSTTADASWCFSCQKVSVLIVSDGLPVGDTKIPGSDFAPTAITLGEANTVGNYAGMGGRNITGISDTDCGLCNEEAEEGVGGTWPTNGCPNNQEHGACGDGPRYPGIEAYLPKVAWYLHHMDLRRDEDLGADCKPMAGKQSLDIYTIGLGTGAGSASTILEHTAYRDPGGNTDNDVGGGFFSGADDAGTLRRAMSAVVADVNSRSTSFSGAGVSRLQTTAGTGVLVPRFDPKGTSHWSGRFYRFTISSEFAAGCVESDPSSTTFGAGDLDCDHACNSVFLKDSLGRFIQEDDDGNFVVNAPPDEPNCGASNKCATCGSPSTTPATPIWEAGATMNAVKWSARKVYTVVDANGDGKIDSTDPLVSISNGTDVSTTVADQLTPYVAAGGPVCTNLASALTVAGNPDGATIQTELAATPKSYRTCVRNMLRYLLGADIFNEKAAENPVWPPAGTAEQANRATMLGDIFHSSPVVVIPPVKKGPFCESATLAEPQCIMTLYSTSPNAERYDYYAGSISDLGTDFNPIYKHRGQFALVGANDLLLHAFHTGTHVTDDRPAPYDGHWDDGTGEEIWAFAPPDLLPKLPLLVATGGAHQYYVDASPAVRDIWVDGSSNKLGGGTVDDKKQESEYHTVAVLGERRGGTHYFALDVTNASKEIDSKPAFLWIYPQPGSPESNAFGWTFQSFLPRPPSIGPVRIKATTVYDDTRTGPDSSGDTVPFHERYVTILSGGYDPQYARGHGIYMVDVWTGKKIWDFVEPASGSGVAADDPRWNLKFPVVATVSMTAWGNGNKRIGLPTTDSWFDTATFGDTGGQIWALRFYDPGELDPVTGQIREGFTNWTGARLFQGGGVTDVPNLRANQPFFQMAANVFTSVDSSLRVVLGSGDAMNLLDKNGGTCDSDNIRACSLSGCQIAVDEAFNNAGSTGSYTVAGATVSASGNFSMTHGIAAGAADSCGVTPSSSSVDLSVKSCPNPLVEGSDNTNRRGGGTCSVEGGTFACEASPTNGNGRPVKTAAEPAITLGNCFYAIRVFEEANHPIFNDPDGAKLYDSKRISESTERTEGKPVLKKIDPNNLAPQAVHLATSTDDGWYMCYNNSDSVTDDGITYVAVDERTATAATVAANTGCATWSTIQPLQSQAVASGTCSLSPCTSGGDQLAYMYGARVATGDLCLGYDASAGAFTKRSISWRTGAPPAPQTSVTFVNGSGQVSHSLVSMRVPEGASAQSIGGAEDLVQMIKWLDVDRATHDCRHVGGGECK